MNLSVYKKSISAVVTGVLGWSAIVIASEPTAITASEWQFLAVGLATALGVFTVSNARA